MSGYFRFPTIYKDNIAFVAEDDIWSITKENNSANRLTTNYGEVTCPVYSPNGKYLAYIGKEDGNTEIFIMPSSGGVSRRITYEGAFIANIASWKNNDIIYSSSLDSPFGRTFELRTINSSGGLSESLNIGSSNHISSNENGTVLGKNTGDLARWKRYKGGTAGKLLIDNNNNGIFKELIRLKGNLTCPLWIDNRIYFLSDHEGISNIYSCLKNGKSIKKHTNHKNYFARNAKTDGINIIYHAGADLFIFNVTNNRYNKIDILFNSSRVQTSRKFSNTFTYLEKINSNKTNTHLNIISRGKAFTFGNWNGPVIQHGIKNGVRYNHPHTMNDDKSILLTSDKNNKNNLEIHSISSNKMIKRFKSNLGRVLSIKKSPKDDIFSVVNHKHEILLFDSNKDKVVKIDRSKYFPLQSNWSPCGKYIAYSCAANSRCSIIKIYDVKNRKSFTITDEVHHDYSPTFNNDGSILAFISKRTFKPVYDSLQFDLGFPVSEKIYIVTLDKNVKSPFIKDPFSNEDKKDDKKKDSKNKKKKDFKIDFQNISDRIIEIPIKETILSNKLEFVKDKLFFIDWPVMSRNYDENINNKGILKFYDLSNCEEKTYLVNINGFSINNNKIIINDGSKIRICDPNIIPPKEMLTNPKFNKTTGLIDLNRVKVSINPIEEWKQMYSEAWRLQKDHFWVSNMSGINWKKIHDRYYRLIDRVSSRTEFSDLIWEMQGELGTSHCYEMGGDYKQRRVYHDGLLGSKIIYNEKKKMYQIDRIFKGDVWQHPQSPLIRPGLNISTGDFIEKINGQKLTKKMTPGKILVNNNNTEVELSIIDCKNNKRRKVTVKTISSDKSLLYRDWVENNKKYVHTKSKGKIGYIHIPDMGVPGYAEFHRHFLTEINYDGLVVDVRYNGGGHVSQLLLSKLARKRIGANLTRWMGSNPYPDESPAGPMVAITNEFAGSDGDIFSHSWKLMKLGKLIGKRTWGGVIGIWPRNSLVDGTLTSQPEFSFWFKDVGWNVENYGTDVDIEIDNMPQDIKNNKDNQLNKAIELILKDLKKKDSILIPDFSNKPNLKLP